MLKKIVLVLVSCTMLCFAALAQAANTYDAGVYKACKAKGYTVFEDDKMDAWDIALYDYLADNDDARDVNFYPLSVGFGKGENAVATKRIIVFRQNGADVTVVNEYAVSDNGEIVLREGDTNRVVRAGSYELARNFYDTDKANVITYLEGIPESGLLNASKYNYTYQLVRLNGRTAAFINAELLPLFDRSFKGGYAVTAFSKKGDIVQYLIVDDGVHNIYKNGGEPGWQHLYSDEPVG